MHRCRHRPGRISSYHRPTDGSIAGSEMRERELVLGATIDMCSYDHNATRTSALRKLACLAQKMPERKEEIFNVVVRA